MHAITKSGYTAGDTGKLQNPIKTSRMICSQSLFRGMRYRVAAQRLEVFRGAGCTRIAKIRVSAIGKSEAGLPCSTKSTNELPAGFAPEFSGTTGGTGSVNKSQIVPPARQIAKPILPKRNLAGGGIRISQSLRTQCPQRPV